MLDAQDNSLDAQLRVVLEHLYPGLSRLAPYVAWRMGFPEHVGEDALHDAIVLFLQRVDAQQWQEGFLHENPRRQIGYFLTAMCNNGLKRILRNRLDPLPETPREDKTSPDPAEEVEKTDAVRKAWQSLPKRQKEVIAPTLRDYIRQEMAETSNISAVNTRQQRFKAAKNMQKFLSEQDTMP